MQYDSYLDQVITGPSFLADPTNAKIIIESWLYLEKRHSLLIDAISVMPNHVHIQLSTISEGVTVNSKALLASHRKWTARLINQNRNLEGEKVWATPFFDRDVRRSAFGTVFWYILENPVKARLCTDYRSWSGNYWRDELVD
jgi:REP element-mobilizing transposase RayT